MSNTRPIPFVVACLMLFIVALAAFDHAHHVAGDLFDEGHTIPVSKKHAGLDFRVVHDQAAALSNGIDSYLKVQNVYPPLVAVLAFPFAALDGRTAYRVFTVALLLALLAGIFLALKENSSFFGGLGDNRALLVISLLLFAVFYNTYPVMFSIERGNCDLLAALFCTLSLYAATRGRLTLCAVSLTVAIHYKLYPLVLIAIVFPQFGWRIVPPLIVGNAAASLVLGPRAFMEFFLRMEGFSKNPAVWCGNHSIFSILKNAPSLDQRSTNLLVSAVFLALFLAAWLWVHRKAVGRLFLLERGTRAAAAPFSAAEVGLIGMAFQLMSLIPTTSHDYQLVVQIVPLVMIATRRGDEFRLNGTVYRVLMLSLMVSMAFLFSPRFDVLTATKALALVANFFVFLLFAFSGRSGAHAPASRPSASPPASS